MVVDLCSGGGCGGGVRVTVWVIIEVTTPPPHGQADPPCRLQLAFPTYRGLAEGKGGNVR